MKLLRASGWILLSFIAAACLGVLALRRGETISAAWVVAAAVASFAIGYRFYARTDGPVSCVRGGRPRTATS